MNPLRKAERKISRLITEMSVGEHWWDKADAMKKNRYEYLAAAPDNDTIIEMVDEWFACHPTRQDKVDFIVNLCYYLPFKYLAANGLEVFTLILDYIDDDSLLNECSANCLGSTPLIAACYNGGYYTLEFVQMLLSRGANPEVRSNGREHETALIRLAAASRGWDEDVTQRRYIPAAELLINAGADVNAMDAEGRTPLLWTGRYNKTFATYLKGKGATRDNKYRAIHGAGRARVKNPEAVAAKKERLENLPSGAREKAIWSPSPSNMSREGRYFVVTRSTGTNIWLAPVETVAGNWKNFTTVPSGDLTPLEEPKRCKLQYSVRGVFVKFNGDILFPCNFNEK